METEKIGLKRRPRKDGTVAFYWVASTVSPKAKDYPLKTVRVHGSMDEVTAKCRALTSELRQWLSERGAGQPVQFDGKLRSLIKMYRSNPASPYFEVKQITRTMYDDNLDLLDRDCGMRRLDKLTGIDIKEWYHHFKQPKAPGEKERFRRAYKVMQLLRIVVGFGVMSNVSECFRLKSVLEELRFHAPRGRKEALSFAQAVAICETAMKKGRTSVALAQALQFELTLRQVDVIGQWEKIEDDDSGSGIVDRGQRWRDGLLWSDIDIDGVLVKTTSKTGKIAAHDTMQYPLLRSIIDQIPAEKRVGPVIRSEVTGLPYRRRYFIEVWREIATEAGVPKTVWNRDSRAGGITEGGDAGADIELLRHQANHDDAATTQIYNRNTLEKTRAVAQLRIAHRANQNTSKT